MILHVDIDALLIQAERHASPLLRDLEAFLDATDLAGTVPLEVRTADPRTWMRLRRRV